MNRISWWPSILYWTCLMVLLKLELFSFDVVLARSRKTFMLQIKVQRCSFRTDCLLSIAFHSMQLYLVAITLDHTVEKWYFTPDIAHTHTHTHGPIQIAEKTMYKMCRKWNWRENYENIFVFVCLHLNRSQIDRFPLICSSGIILIVCAGQCYPIMGTSSHSEIVIRVSVT